MQKCKTWIGNSVQPSDSQWEAHSKNALLWEMGFVQELQSMQVVSKKIFKPV